MFSDRAFGKKRREKANAAAASAAAQREPDPTPKPTDAQRPVGPGHDSRPPGPGHDRPGASATPGISIEQYARVTGLPESEVWRRVRRGELVGRNSHGQLLIYELGAAPTERAGAMQASPMDLEALPPLPSNLPAVPNVGAGALALTERAGHSQELALLLDHLSLAKEENREILRMTQDSIRKVTELSDSIVEMKDAVIEAKDAQLAAQRGEVERLQEEIRKLRQHNEDLDTLTRALAKS